MRLSDKTLKAIKFRIEMFENASRSGGVDFYETAERMKDVYKGEHWPNEVCPDHRVTVNYAQVNVDILHSSIAYAEPDIQIIPRTPQAEKNVEYQEMALTKTLEDINALSKFRLILQDSIITGLGIGFVGWRYETVDVVAQEGLPDREESELSDIFPEDEPLPTLIDKLPSPMGMMQPEGQLPSEMEGMMPPPTGMGQMTPPEIDEPLPGEEVVVWDNPIVRRVSPRKLFVDPDHLDLTDLADARYLIEELMVPLEDVQSDKRYSSVRHKLKGTSVLSTDYISQDMSNDSHARRVRIYSYWQKAGRIHAYLTDEYPDEPLYVEEWPYPFTSYPYSCLVYRSIPDEQFPQGQIEPAETLVKELDLYRTRALSHDDRFAKGFVPYDGSGLTSDGKRALLSGADGAFVETTKDPNAVFGQFPGAPLPGEVYQHQNDIKQDLSNMMAVIDWDRGTPDKTRRTKGEVNTIVSRSSVRGQDIQRSFERYIEGIAGMILRLLQDERFCDTSRWGRMTGQQPLIEWNHSNLKGESEVRVIVNSTRVQTPESEQQKWAQIMQAVGPLAQAGGINVVPIIEEALKAYDVSPTKIAEIAQKNNPMLVEIQKTLQQVGQMGKQMSQQMQAIQKFVVKQDQRLTKLEQQLDVGKADLKTRADVDAKMRTTEMKILAAQQKMRAKEQEMQFDSQHSQDTHQFELASMLNDMHSRKRESEHGMRLKTLNAVSKAKTTQGQDERNNESKHK